MAKKIVWGGHVTESEPLKYGIVKREEKLFFPPGLRASRMRGNLRLLEAIKRSLNIKPAQQ